MLRSFCESFVSGFLILINHFVHKTRTKFVNKENVAVVKMTSTWSSEIFRSYKLVKGHRHRSKLPLPVCLVGGPKHEAPENSDNFIYKTANFKSGCADFL